MKNGHHLEFYNQDLLFYLHLKLHENHQIIPDLEHHHLKNLKLRDYGNKNQIQTDAVKRITYPQIGKLYANVHCVYFNAGTL